MSDNVSAQPSAKYTVILPDNGILWSKKGVQAAMSTGKAGEQFVLGNYEGSLPFTSETPEKTLGVRITWANKVAQNKDPKVFVSRSTSAEHTANAPKAHRDESSQITVEFSGLDCVFTLGKWGTEGIPATLKFSWDEAASTMRCTEASPLDIVLRHYGNRAASVASNPLDFARKAVETIDGKPVQTGMTFESYVTSETDPDKAVADIVSQALAKGDKKTAKALIVDESAVKPIEGSRRSAYLKPIDEAIAKVLAEVEAAAKAAAAKAAAKEAEKVEESPAAPAPETK